MDKTKLSKKIINYRADNNLSQKELAEMCKTSAQTICNVENEKQNPSKLTLQKILKIIGE